MAGAGKRGCRAGPGFCGGPAEIGALKRPRTSSDLRAPFAWSRHEGQATRAMKLSCLGSAENVAGLDLHQRHDGVDGILAAGPAGCRRRAPGSEPIGHWHAREVERNVSCLDGKTMIVEGMRTDTSAVTAMSSSASSLRSHGRGKSFVAAANNWSAALLPASCGRAREARSANLWSSL